MKQYENMLELLQLANNNLKELKSSENSIDLNDEINEAINLTSEMLEKLPKKIYNFHIRDYEQYLTISKSVKNAISSIKEKANGKYEIIMQLDFICNMFITADEKAEKGIRKKKLKFFKKSIDKFQKVC